MNRKKIGRKLRAVLPKRPSRKQARWALAYVAITLAHRTRSFDFVIDELRGMSLDMRTMFDEQQRETLQ